jgi:Starch binding domain
MNTAATAALVAASMTMLTAGFSVAGADTVQSGVFLSYNVDKWGTSVTIEQAGHPMVVTLARDAVTRERAAGEQWQVTSLASLQPGEPVSLQLTSGGIAHGIDAEYQTVSTRLVLHKNDSIITSSGDVYTLTGKAAQTPARLELGTYLLLRVDPHTSRAFDLAASTQPFAAAGNENKVTVTFVVSVPVNTPPSDVIYLSSNTTNWSPNGVRMSPLTGNRWSAALALPAGSSLQYKYTRGSWSTDERNAAGIEIANRSLSVVKSGPAQAIKDTVTRWADLPS